MPAFDEDSEAKTLPFPPLSHSHILHCSYHHWHSLYKSIAPAITPKARLIPLPDAFVEYLRADGIVLPPDGTRPAPDDERWSSPTSDDDDADADPSQAWAPTHALIQSTIALLGGRVAPKLNWSAPKDATWINPTNSQACDTANDIYLLLKSSDFITHDLEHAFDGCASSSDGTPPPRIPYHLVLRKWFAANPSVEFRCFVRRRVLLGVCQRDLNHYDFLPALRPRLIAAIRGFFERHLRDSFPDESFAFDVYVPAPHERVWLVDVNPWAGRTDPLLFSWLELLTMPEPDFVGVLGEEAGDGEGESEGHDGEGQEPVVVRVPLRAGANMGGDEGREVDDDDEDEETPLELEPTHPLELRLIRRTDPEAYAFNSPQYSAHKLPVDVVDASRSGPGPMADFAAQWRAALERRAAGEDDDDEGESSTDGDNDKDGATRNGNGDA